MSTKSSLKKIFGNAVQASVTGFVVGGIFYMFTASADDLKNLERCHLASLQPANEKDCAKLHLSEILALSSSLGVIAFSSIHDKRQARKKSARKLKELENSFS